MVTKQCNCQKSFLIKKIHKKFNDNNLGLKTQITPEKEKQPKTLRGLTSSFCIMGNMNIVSLLT